MVAFEYCIWKIALGCILKILKIAFGSIFQDIAKSLYFKCPDQDEDTYLMEFDILRQKAEARMIMGGGSPDESVSVLCMQIAALAKNETTLVSHGFHTALVFPQRRFGQFGRNICFPAGFS